MSRHLFLILRKIIGLIVIILGLIGTLVPIPLVPFFLLIFVGLGIFGLKPETIKKIKLRLNEFKKKFLNR
jgi:uncharacterized protein YqgC (DUF456 family)